MQFLSFFQLACAVLLVSAAFLVLRRWTGRSRPRAPVPQCDLSDVTVDNAVWIHSRVIGDPVSPRASKGAGPSIPAIIWTYWDNDDPRTWPDLVRACIASWRAHNPDTRVHVVTPRTVRTYVPDFDPARYSGADASAQKLTDGLRLRLLWRYGGIWMDASILCRDSLDWVEGLRARTGAQMVAFHLDAFTRAALASTSPVVESWFLAAPPNAPFVKAWHTELCRVASFPSVAAYIEHVERHQSVDLQHIPPSMKEYLYIHAAAQCVLQTTECLRQTRPIATLPAERGPLAHLARNKFDVKRAIRCFEPDREQAPASPFLIKFRGIDRQTLARSGDKSLPPVLAAYMARHDPATMPASVR